VSSYFDDADELLRIIFEMPNPDSKKGREPSLSFFWKLYRAWEVKLIADCLSATRAKKFPRELGAKIELAILRERVFATSKATKLNERNMQSLLSMRTSFLSSRLHSLFHEVASWGTQNKVRHLNDNPAWIAKRAPR
jgi:hypothetical protein